MRAVWMLWGLATAAIVVTYSRVSPDDLYHVSHGGIAGGLGRALVFVNYPIALVALAIAAIAADRLRRPAGDVLAVVAGGFCAVVIWPGVVDQGDLDAKLVNVLPAIGVGLVLALSLAIRDESHRLGAPRVAAALVLAVLSIPWIAAELGAHVGLGIFLSGQLRVHGSDPTAHPAVHLGDHHGLNGVLLVLTALLLWPLLGGMRRRPLRGVTRAYLGLMISYGLVNAANDFWLEQVVKRGWTDREIPSGLEPRLAPIWAAIVALAAGVVAIDVARTKRKGQQDASHHAIIAT